MFKSKIGLHILGPNLDLYDITLYTAPKSAPNKFTKMIEMLKKRIKTTI